MPCCQCRCLVEEEQLGPLAARHDLARRPVLPLQNTSDPGLEGVTTNDALGFVMDYPAVTGEGAALGSGDYPTERINPILQGHVI